MNPIHLVLSLNEAALVLTALRGSEGAGANATLDGVIGDLQTLVHRAENPDLDAGEEPFDGFRTDAEADGDALASAGYGTDEDYRCDDHQYCDDQY